MKLRTMQNGSMDKLVLHKYDSVFVLCEFGSAGYYIKMILLQAINVLSFQGN